MHLCVSMAVESNINFLRLGRSDHDLVRHIEVAPEQIVYCGTVDMAFAAVEEDLDLYAILAADKAVGFFKIDLKFPRTYSFARAGIWG